MIDTVRSMRKRTLGNEPFMLIHKTVFDRRENNTREDMRGQKDL